MKITPTHFTSSYYNTIEALKSALDGGAFNSMEIDDRNCFIVGITRGGLIPAQLTAYSLSLKKIVNVEIESYSDTLKQKMSDARIIDYDLFIVAIKRRLKEAAQIGKLDIIITDDLIATGDTVITLIKSLNEIIKDTEESDYLNGHLTVKYHVAVAFATEHGIDAVAESDVSTSDNITVYHSGHYIPKDTWLTFYWDDDFNKEER